MLRQLDQRKRVARRDRSRFVGGMVVDDDQLDLVGRLSEQGIKTPRKRRRRVAGGYYRADSRRL